MVDFGSITVYVAESDIDHLLKLCCELPYLSCVYDAGYPDGEINGEKIYPVDLMLDMVEGV